MQDKCCEVCRRDPATHPAIGVACTSMPYSCSFCSECLSRGADPLVVFECWYETIGEPDKHACPDGEVTYYRDKYVTYREWYAARSLIHDAHVIDWHYSRIGEEVQT